MYLFKSHVSLHNRNFSISEIKLVMHGIFGKNTCTILKETHFADTSCSKNQRLCNLAVREHRMFLSSNKKKPYIHRPWSSWETLITPLSVGRINEELLIKLRLKKDAYRTWKQDQVMQEYKDTV